MSDDTAGLRKTLEILRALAVLGIVEQIMTDQGVVWKAKGSAKRWAAITAALKLR